MDEPSTRPADVRPDALQVVRRNAENVDVSAAHTRLGAVIRRVIGAALRPDLDEASADALAERLEAIAASLPEPTPSRYGDDDIADYRRVGPAAINRRGTHPIFGSLAPAGVDMVITHEGGELRIGVTFDARHEGMPGCVHGGHLMAGFDYALLQAAAVAAIGGPTGTLSVRFLRPTPIRVPLEYRTRVTAREGRRTTIRGELLRLDDGTVCCEGEAVAVSPRPPAG